VSAPRIRLLVLTSDHRRHRWVAARLAGVATLAGIVVESKPEAEKEPEHSEIRAYFAARRNAEERWFGNTGRDLDCQRHEVAWGGSNSRGVYEFIIRLEPDLIALFGSSIIRDPLLGRMRGRIVNMHLGLSPYYRGSATNFWPLVDGLPECVGVTIHHATPAVDGGAIIAQVRPPVSLDDTSHDLGCKAIIAGCDALARVIASTAESALGPGVAQRPGGRLCRRSDFTVDAVRRLNRNLAAGMLSSYVLRKDRRDSQFPIHSGAHDR
jgi:folate-dependent phosphoribosylglycinamide formyltransferase PurN